MPDLESPTAPTMPAVEPVVPAHDAAAQFSAVLHAARKRLLGLAWLEVALGALAGLGVAVVVALVVLGVVPFSLGLRRALWGLLALSTVTGALVVVMRRVRPLAHDLVIARALEEALSRHGHAIGDAVRGAVELLSTSDDAIHGRSRALANAHIAHTARQIHDGKGTDGLPAVALERALPTLLSTSAIGLVVLVWGTLGHDSFVARWAKLTDAHAAAVALDDRAATALPLVTDLKLTLRLPQYMAEPDQVIAGSSGDVTAPRGTEVILEGRAERPVSKAALVIGDNETALDVSDGRTLKGRFVLDATGSYRFRLTFVHGGDELDPVAHKLTVKADSAPTVDLQAPAQDAVVKLDEKVPLVFSGKDDVGLTKFRVVVVRQGSAREPYTHDLLELPTALREARGKGELSIADTGARAGDKLSVYVEAVDNDTVSGPKAGRSVTRVLSVFSPAEHHEQVIERLEDVLSRMTDALADELESPLAVDDKDPAASITRHAPIVTRESELMKALDDSLLALSDDKMASAALRRALANVRLQLQRPYESMREGLASSKRNVDDKRAIPSTLWRRVVVDQSGLVAALEKNIVYLEDLLNQERIREAQDTANDLKRAQADLKELLDQYKKSGDEKTKQALLDEIKRMQKEMQQLTQKLAKLRHDIPDEFLNEEAFKGDERMQQAMDLDKMIEEGKLDDAAKALDDMIKGTEKLLTNLDETNKEYGGPEYKEVREKLDRFSQDLDALHKGEEQQLKESQKLLDEARKETEQRLKGKLDKLLPELKRKAEKAQADLAALDKDAMMASENDDAAIAKARTDDIKKALENGDLEDAMAAAQEAEASTRILERSIADRTRGRFGSRNKATLDAKDKVSEARPLLNEIRAALNDVMPDPSQLLGKDAQRRMQKGSDQQAQLGENAQKLSQLMEEIGKDAPVFGPSHKSKLDDAKGQMQRATQEMKAGNVRGARAAQQQALRRLGELKDALNQQGQGGEGGGVPMPLPGGGSPGGEQREGEGGRHSGEDVKIPDGSDFKVPDAWRKDILDAMREGVPQNWSAEVKRYYEELIK